MNKTMKDMKRLMYASFFLLASCTQEGNNIPDASGADKLVPLTVSAVSMAGDGTGADTRATTLPIPVTSGKVSVGVRGVNGYTQAAWMEYTYSSGAWTFDASSSYGSALLLSEKTASLFAFWPADAESGYSLDATFEISGMQTQPYAFDKDLCYATSGGDNVCAVHPYAGFVMKHAYSRVRVEVAFSPQLVDAGTVLDSVTVAATGLMKTGYPNVETGAFYSSDPITELKWKSGSALSTLANKKFIGDVLVVPSPTLTDAKLTIALGGSNYISDLSSALTTLEAGKSYRIRVVMGTSLIIDGVETEAWINAPTQTGDTRYETGIPPAVNDNTVIDQWTNGSSASGDTELQ